MGKIDHPSIDELASDEDLIGASQKGKDSDAIQLLILNRMQKFIKSQRKKAGALIDKLRDFEDNFRSRVYPLFMYRLVTKSGKKALRPKIHIYGSDMGEITAFDNAFSELLIDCGAYAEKLENLLTEKLNQAFLIDEQTKTNEKDQPSDLFTDLEELSSIPDPIERIAPDPIKLEPDALNPPSLSNGSLFQSQIEKQIKEHEYLLRIKTEINVGRSTMDYIVAAADRIKQFTKQYTRFALPAQTSVEQAKLLRQYLIEAFHIARQVELLFTEMYPQTLEDHSEVREDYQSMEENIRLIMRNFVVTDAVIYLDPQEFMGAFQEIIFSLGVIQGDLKGIQVRLLLQQAQKTIPPTKIRSDLQREAEKALRQKLKDEKPDKKKGDTNI